MRATCGGYQRHAMPHARFHAESAQCLYEQTRVIIHELFMITIALGDSLYCI